METLAQFLGEAGLEHRPGGGEFLPKPRSPPALHKPRWGSPGAGGEEVTLLKESGSDEDRGSLTHHGRVSQKGREAVRTQTASSANPAAAHFTSESQGPVAPAPGNQARYDKSVFEGAIRLHAFWTWRLAGEPEGQDLKFWLEAERQLLQSKEVVTQRLTTRQSCR